MLGTLVAPQNISALTTVTQDNTGKVTFLPRGEGVTQYETFGDGTTAPACGSRRKVDHTIKKVFMMLKL
jgi:hypothetical protein